MGEDIFIESLFLVETYAGVLAGHPSHLPALIMEGVKKDAVDVFGANTRLLMVETEKLDLNKKLPEERVIALTKCNKPANDARFFGSFLLLTWFQNSNEDPFIRATKILETIDWQREAEDYDA